MTTATDTFPDGFVWGVATASFQIEGASKDAGRLPSIWDEFCQTPGKVVNGDTGDVACDHYNLFQEDVAIMKRMGVHAYRFSIAWPRIVPLAGAKDDPDISAVNEQGVDFYNRLIDCLISNGIQPVATLYHWDLPLALETRSGGLLGTPFIAAFNHYSDVCFSRFGDRVKQWITFNEPWCSAALGYAVGEHAPGHTQHPGIEPYVAGHNMLLAHAHAVHNYRSNYMDTQAGCIGITLNAEWIEPVSADTADIEAAQGAMDHSLGWFADPVYFGDYPASMKERLGARLPAFSEAEKSVLKGSSDFFGLNHYSSKIVKARKTTGLPAGYMNDYPSEDVDPGDVERTDMGWAVIPWGFRKLLLYIHQRYTPVGGIVVTENGCAAQDSTFEEAEKNDFRERFLRSYLTEMRNAISEGANVAGYYCWSLLDNFEWAFGYEKRFGLVWVDYKTLERKIKPAGSYYSNVVRGNKVI